MSKIIEFEDQPAPEAEPKDEGEDKTEARFARLEKAVMKLAEVMEKMQEEPAPAPEPAPAAEPEPAPAAEPEPEPKDEVAEEIKELTKKLQTMSKKVEQLETAPARITNPAHTDNTNDRINQFLSEVTGGEMLVYCEKKGIPWGQKGD